MKTVIIMAGLFLGLICGCQSPQTNQPIINDDQRSEPQPQSPRTADLFTPEWPYGRPDSYSERKALIEKAILHDGMTKTEAISILGPPTAEKDDYLDWYYNPGGRWHVTAFFHSEIRDGKTYNWRTGNK